MPVLFVPPSSARRAVRRALKPLRPVAVASLLVIAGAAPAADYVWSSGAFSGTGLPGTVTLNDTLSLSCPPGSCGTKVLDGSLLNNGYVYATDNLYFQYTSQVLTNAWQYQLQGDVGLLNGYAGGTFINEGSGSLVKTAGTGTSLIGISSQHKGGSLVDAMTGRLEFSGATTFDANAQLLAASGASIAFTGGGLSLGAGVKLYGAGRYEIGTDTQVLGNLGATDLVFTNGTYTGSGSTLTSNAAWTGSGSFGGSWTVAAGVTLSAADTGNHYIRGTVGNLGTLDTQGHLYFEYANYQVSNAGTLNLRGDVGLYNTYSGGTLLNTGTLAKVAGDGTSFIQGINVSNDGGRFDVQRGTLQFSGGTLQFNDGTRFTGAGQSVVASAARFAGRIDSDNLVLAGASYDGGDGGLHASAMLHGRTTITGGAFSGQWDLAADHQLSLNAGGGLYVRGTVNNAGSFSVGANLYFEYTSYLLNNTGSLRLANGAGLFSTYAGGSFSNAGTLTVAAGSANTSTIQGLTTSVAGTVNVDSGTLQFSGGSLTLDSTARLQAAAGTTVIMGGTNTFVDGARLLGAGQYQIAGDTSVTGQIGAEHLSFTSGAYTGYGATLASDATWTGNGSFNNAWTVAAGRTLTATDNGNHYIRGTVSNLGTLDTQGHLYFEYASYRIENAGTLNLRGDAGLYTTYAGGTVVNTGTFAKVAGTGTSAVQGLTFINNGGLIDVQTGTLQFSGGQLAFNDGTRFTGAGQVVTSSARFAGQIAAANLSLDAGTYTGGDGAGQTMATVHGHTTTHSAALEGYWTFAEDHQLTLNGTTAIRGTVVNQGQAVATGNLDFQYPSQVLVNQGRLTLKADASLVNSYAGGTFVNLGTLVKNDGAGTSSLAGLTVTNAGTMEVQTGTLALPSGFLNAGTLKGVGSFSTDTLTNEGHITPGNSQGTSAVTSPGTLTLASHLVLGSNGSLDLALNAAALHDLLLVQGDVTLGGTLALSCWGACSFAAGTDLLVLDASGTLAGSFSQVTFAGFDMAAFEVRLDALNGDVWLHATQDIAAVPEPASYALWLSGIGLMGWIARRRRAQR
jgi:hypothetical protein